MLCFLPKFDLANDPDMCPPERNALIKFYEAAKGQDWTYSAGWLDPYQSVCSWYGVTCNSNGHVTKLNLMSNGLTGTLSKAIADLPFLEFLDLSDNDIMVSVLLNVLTLLFLFAYLTSFIFSSLGKNSKRNGNLVKLTAGLPISCTWGLCHNFCCRGPILNPRPVLESPA